MPVGLPEIAVKALEKTLLAAIDAAPAGILVTTEDGTIALVNRQLEVLFGYSRDELVGQPVELLVPGRARVSHPRSRAEFLASPTARPMGLGRDLRGLRKDGSEVPLEIGLTPVETQQGRLVVCTVVDLTTRKRAEERFRIAVEASPSGLVMIDRSGVIVLANRELERSFGYARDELLGQRIDVLVPRRFRDEHPGHRLAFFGSPNARAMGSGRDLYGVRRDGTEVPVEIGLNPIETDEGLFVLGTIVDISARKRAQEERARLEQRLRHSQKMEIVGRLAAGVAHDFNNILGAIMGYAELVLDAVSGGETAPLADPSADLRELLAVAERGTEIVRRILAVTRRQESVRRPVPMQAAVEEALKVVRPTLPAKVRVRAELSQRPALVNADAAALHQILSNLLSNAAQAMPAGGIIEVAVRVEERPVDGGGLESCVVLSVCDSGHGMDPDTLAQAVEPFFTTKPPGAGTGLGLAIVDMLVREHEGSLHIASRVGEGTTIVCVFPRVRDLGSVRPEPHAPVAMGQGQRVLYIDDEPMIARPMKRRLELVGYEAVVTVDPIEGLRMFSEAPEAFDAVITDFSMAKMNGLEVARRLHLSWPSLPIVLLTGHLEPLDDGDVGAAGVRLVLRKPVTAAQLAEALQGIFAPRSQ